MSRLLLTALLLAQAVALSAQPPRHYLFSYFINNGEDGLHLLSSSDGLQWTPVNGGRSFLYPHVGSRLMRDPSIARGPDGMFHLVWTTGWWDKGIGIAHSKDLIEWSPQQFLPVMEGMRDARNCWAPEIFYDEDEKRFLIFWATTTVRTPDSQHRIYYVETKDFVTYSTAKPLFDDGFSVIDAFIVKAAPGRFTMILKDERELPAPTKHLRIAEATRASGPYTPASPPFSVDWVEGPSVLKRGDRWVVYYDEYTRRKYGALQSADLKTWQPVEGLSFPRGVRHGTAFEVAADVAAKVARHSTAATENRWAVTSTVSPQREEGGIAWLRTELDPAKPHQDHLEMSGLRVSAIVQYGADRDGTLLLWRRAVWPMLRTIPNNTQASLQQQFGPADAPVLSIDGKPVEQEKLRRVAFNGVLTLETQAQGVSLRRNIFPSPTREAVIETVAVHNQTQRAVRVSAARAGLTVNTDAARGVDGVYIVEATTDAPVDWTLKPGEARSYAIVYSARRAGDPALAIRGRDELAERQAWLHKTAETMVLETPVSILNRAFEFAKVRATESIFATKGGLMHGPGGGRYYAAIWANDQAEYANPFFALLGAGAPRESAMNAFRHFARLMNPDYRPIPSSIIAEGTGTWHGAGDRGDQAMIAYGAARFALAAGDRAQAEELWPLIEWCLEYLRRKMTPDGVIASDSDELENRFPAGKANLNTASLTYDALLSAAMLAESLAKPEATIAAYRDRARTLRAAIDRHFAATIDGFETYRYYDGNTTLRAWIATPLTVGIYDRAQATTDALFSPGLWTRDGLATEAGKPDFWDRSTLYALRGVIASGDTARGLARLLAYSSRRLLGEHVPYAVEAYPEGGQAHLSAESALYCRIFVEGLFGLRPTGLATFTLTPRLPDGWDRMSLRAVHAFGRIFDIEIRRSGPNILVRVVPDRGPNTDRTITPGGTVAVAF